MISSYPKWIPNPDPVDVLKNPEIQVPNIEVHKAKNFAHYEEELAEKPVSVLSLEQAVQRERERCAKIAESFDKKDIAAAIRSGESYAQDDGIFG